jgi:sn-glycerol 3-phosphate transport system permease protein
MENTAASTQADRMAPAASGSRKSVLEKALPYLLILPTLALVTLFTLYPAVNTVISSLYEPGRRATDPWAFVGLENYIDLFDSSHFLGSRFTRVLGNTLVFTFATVLIGMPIALMMAILLNRAIRGLGFWRFCVFYPSLLPTIGAASFFAFLYSNEVGLINTVLRDVGLPTVNWLGNPDVVLWSVIVVNIWKQVGYYMIFYLAGLQGIPNDIYEAAELDGASVWQQFFSITLPLLRRTTLFISTVAFIFAFQTVEQLQVLNQGNPADRANLVLYFIFQSIGERRNQGYINAMTVILVAILLLFTVTNFYMSERGGREE